MVRHGDFSGAEQRAFRKKSSINFENSGNTNRRFLFTHETQLKRAQKSSKLKDYELTATAVPTFDTATTVVTAVPATVPASTSLSVSCKKLKNTRRELKRLCHAQLRTQMFRTQISTKIYKDLEKEDSTVT